MRSSRSLRGGGRSRRLGARAPPARFPAPARGPPDGARRLDAESAYRSAADIAADQARDPLVATARLLVSRGVAGPGEILACTSPCAVTCWRPPGTPRNVPSCAVPWKLWRRWPRRGPPPSLAWRPARATRGRGGRSSADASRGGGTADAGAGDQPHAGRPAGQLSGADGVRRGRGDQGRRLRRHPGAAEEGRGGPGLRHPAGRAVDPRPCARRGPDRPAARAEIQYLAYLHNAEDQIAARRPRCSSSRPGSSAIRLSSA